MPTPQAAPGQVVVQVEATGINPGALSALSGSYVPIRDLAGVVTAVGEGVQGFAVGDVVLGWLQDWSAHAQLFAVPAAQLIPKPEALSWDVAGSLYVTAMAGLAGVKAVEPKAGGIVVVSGASGGVGFVSAQLARRAGAAVIGLSSPSNAEWLQAHGIRAVAYGNGQEQRIRAAADGQQIGAFIDAVGTGYVDLALALGLSKERINTVVDFKAAKQQGVKSVGTREAGGLSALQELADLTASGALDIPIAATCLLDQVQAACHRLAERSTRGKIVLHAQE